MNVYLPLTIKQKEYIDRMDRCWFNIAEGGKRGGKNVVNIIGFCKELEWHPDRLHMISGVTQSSAKINILDSDGYGILNYFEGRCREGKYKDKDALFVDTVTGQKIVIVAGGGKRGEEAKIKGNTYGMVYITEANECTREFIKEAFDRTLSSKKRIVIHDFNPKAEGHWYYQEILNFHLAKQRENPNYGVNYGHFTILDNMSIDNNKLKNILNTYDKNSVWFKRDILGERAAAEGLVYQFTDENILSDGVIPRCREYYISCDYGIYNPMAWNFFGVNGDNVFNFEEYHHSGRETPQDVHDDADYIEIFQKWHNELEKKYDCKIRFTLVDPSASSFIIGLRKQGIKIKKAINTVNGATVGIPLVAQYIREQKLKVSARCKYTIREFGLYSWDDRSIVRDTVIKDNDHHMDAIRYLFNTVIRRNNIPDLGIIGA